MSSAIQGWKGHKHSCGPDPEDDGSNSEDEAVHARKGMSLSLELREADDAQNAAYFEGITRSTKGLLVLKDLGLETELLIDSFMGTAGGTEDAK